MNFKISLYKWDIKKATSIRKSTFRKYLSLKYPMNRNLLTKKSDHKKLNLKNGFGEIRISLLLTKLKANRRFQVLINGKRRQSEL